MLNKLILSFHVKSKLLAHMPKIVIMFLPQRMTLSILFFLFSLFGLICSFLSLLSFSFSFFGLLDSFRLLSPFFSLLRKNLSLLFDSLQNLFKSFLLLIENNVLVFLENLFGIHSPLILIV